MGIARRGGIQVAVGIAVAILLTVGGPAAAEAQKPLRKVVVVFASTNFPVGTSPVTHLPKVLGYWQEEGLDVELQGAAGSLPSLQMVVGGKGDVGVVQPITLFQMRPKGTNVKAFYTFIRHNWFFPAVLDGSPIRSIKDFKGKKIGVQSMGASMIPFMKLVLAEGGLDPERDVTFVAVGLGAGAAALLHQQQVDILGLWSSQYALMENAGFKLRKFIEVSPLKDLSFAVTFVAKEEWLQKNPEVAVGLGRGWAKATLFALHNAEAVVRLHWKAVPQSKPAGEDESASMRKALHDLQSGLTFMRIDTARVKKWGATTREEVEAYAGVLLRAGLLEGKPGAPDDYYTGEFVEKTNDFDQGRIIEQARAYKP